MKHQIQPPSGGSDNYRKRWVTLSEIVRFFKNVAADVIATAQAPDFKIKSALTWAEDFHGVENRLFSNTQKQSFNLQPYDLMQLKNELCVAIRSTSKMK